MNHLYFGDNLNVLRESVPDESVDLIYLDPPFNSSRNYNVLFSSPKGERSSAQIEAFEDTWHWGEQAEREFAEIVRGANSNVSEMIQGLRGFLGENDVMAYLVMMTNRLLELSRVLNATGSIYLHCDPTASHYIKILMDGIFGAKNFRNEIVWKRTSSHNSAKRWGPVHDVLLFYTKGETYTWNRVAQPYDKSYLDAFYKFEDADGRYRLGDLTGAGVRAGDSGKPWKGVNPTATGRHWAVPAVPGLTESEVASLTVQERLDHLEDRGLIYWPPKGKVPAFKRYLEPGKGVVIQDVITDVDPLSTHSKERLGYPTQKPIELLDRILLASSSPGNVVLDPFCGCGTAVDSAQGLGRNWIGIDITHLAISLIEKRLKDRHPGVSFQVHGTPRDFEGARNLAMRDKYQFQWWACSLVNAQPYQGKKKGADGGIDGLIWFTDDGKVPKKIVVSVKGGENVSVAMVRELAHVTSSQKAEIGILVSLNPPTGPMRNEAHAAGFYKSPITGALFPKIQILTVEGLLNRTERALYPDLSSGGLTFKKATVHKSDANQTSLDLRYSGVEAIPDPDSGD